MTRTQRQTTLSHDDHRRANVTGLAHVYAVLSRRSHGVSIGIDLNPDRGCNFDCIYCQVDRTGPTPAKPSPSVLAQELQTMFSWIADGSLFDHPMFASLPQDQRVVRDIAFSGNGEPTTSPLFPSTVELVADLKRQHGLHDLRLILITNATLLHRPRIQEALHPLHHANGEVWAKLDAGSEQDYHRINRSRVPLDQIVNNIRTVARSWPVVIQTMVLDTGPTPSILPDIDPYLARLLAILNTGGRIRLVQLYSVARHPAEPHVFAVDRAALSSMASTIHKHTGLTVAVYEGSPRFLRPDQPDPLHLQT